MSQKRDTAHKQYIRVKKTDKTWGLELYHDYKILRNAVTNTVRKSMYKYCIQGARSKSKNF